MNLKINYQKINHIKIGLNHKPIDGLAIRAEQEYT